MTSPNESQKEFIETTEGLLLVDAGAGTGKTFSITRRYLRLLEEVEPEDVFLATFTRNAAEEMSSRIARKSDYSASEIFEAPISTFHAFSRKILERHGFDTPELLGIGNSIPADVEVVESGVRESQEFSTFMERFRANHGERHEEFLAVAEEDDLLELLRSLASKGVVPEREGWFGHSGRYVEGNYARFESMFEEANTPEQRNGGDRQSELRRRLYSMKFKEFHPEAPEMEEIRGDYGTKQVRQDFKRRVFEEERDGLESFVHELYFEYLRYCLDRNYLNFAFVMVLAFVTLYERAEVRERESFNYIMIDEFQDTNQVQFKIALLLADEPNIAAVGDWKQSIYSFQHASVENITEFEDRLNNYIFDLGEERAGFSTTGTRRIELGRNYRSGQRIIDAAEQALELPAHRKERTDRPEMVELDADRSEPGMVRKFKSEDEVDAVLAAIEDLREKGRSLEEISVLARTRSFGLELQSRAREIGMPVTYEGGVELFATRPGKLLLAWLRVVSSDSRKGWATVLERAGYTLEECRQILEEGDYPGAMVEFREELAGTPRVAAKARKVFKRYGEDSEFTTKIEEVLRSTFTGSMMNTGEMVEFIERNIEEREIYQVDVTSGKESVTVQTVHSAKGLEYPVVFVSGVNNSIFPSTNTDSKAVRMMGPAGLRQTRKFSEEHGYSFDSWQAEVISKVMSGQYDEERRLMYVAMTRAEEELYVTAEEERESTFYKGLEIEEVEQRSDPAEFEGFSDSFNEFDIPEIDCFYSARSLETELGLEGRRLSVFAAEHLRRGVEPENEREQEVVEFLEEQEGEPTDGVSLIYREGGESFELELPVVFETSEGAKMVEFADNTEQVELLKKKLRAARECLEGSYESLEASVFSPKEAQ